MNAALVCSAGEVDSINCCHSVVCGLRIFTSFPYAQETKFEYEVHQNIQEERQNQLRWYVHSEHTSMNFVEKSFVNLTAMCEG